MRAWIGMGCALMLASASASASAVTVQAPDSDEVVAASLIEAGAVAALEKMGRTLRSLPNFGVTSQSSYRFELEDRRILELDAKVTYKVVQPGKLYINVESGRWDREVYYDGKDLTIWSRPENSYAQVSGVDKNLPELFLVAARDHGIEIPLADLFFWGTAYAPVSSLTAAFEIGPMTLLGEPVVQYAFTQGGADWQLWMSEETGLPRKILVSDRAASSDSISALLTWDTSTKFDASTFKFDAPKGASSIVIEKIRDIYPSSLDSVR